MEETNYVFMFHNGVHDGKWHDKHTVIYILLDLEMKSGFSQTIET